MSLRRWEALRTGEPVVIRYRWVPLERISPDLALAFVASEDQRFPEHHGLDLDAIHDALTERRHGGRSRGASTITQQTVKNLFLWPGRNWVRKGIEACLALAAELAWSKRRILEIYLNVAELGDGVYGVEAAAETYFHSSAAELGPYEASLLATVLPAPRRMRPDRPGPATRSRAAWVRRQMRQLGGAYLDPVLRKE